jgi:hypothetical protein
MQRRLIAIAAATVAAVAFSIVASGQQPARPAAGGFNARDLAGIWSRNGQGFGGGGTCPDCGDRGFNAEFPVFTPAGQAAFDRNIPSYGRERDSEDAKKNPQEHIGRRRAQPPALGNDPYGQCNPMGVTRALIYPDPVEFHVLPDRIIQHFEWHYGVRTIWTDGRTLPPSPPDLLRWWGYSVGRWDGDTFVVESVGHDDRTWLDHFGYPHSDEMRLEERYRRVSADTLELNMTVTDPKYYAKPWTAQTKRFKRLAKDFIQTPDGWQGLLEDLCAPADEFDFHRTIRDPAGTGKPPVPAR